MTDGMSGSTAFSGEAEILELIVEGIVSVLEQRVSKEDIAVDVDVFGGGELVQGLELDSMYLLEIAISIEDAVGISFTEDEEMPDPLTLLSLARYIALQRTS